MGELKIRKIGNSLGAIFPKDWELKEGDILTYEKKGNGYLLDSTETAREHDRQLIEESFAEYEAAKMVSEDQLKERFGKYGWGK